MKNQKLKYSLIGTAAVVACLAVVVCVFYLVPNPLCRKTIGNINTPAGFTRVEVASDSYGAYLRQLPLKSIGSQVHYNKSGYLWRYFPVNAAVVDKPCVSKSEDCADVALHLYADYLFEQGKYSQINFGGANGTRYPYRGGNSQKALEKYLVNIFGPCNTTTMRQTLPHRDFKDLQIGDVFVVGARRKGGMGHAITIADMAVDKHGRKAVLLVEGNYPGVSIHLVKNLNIFQGYWFILDEDAPYYKFWMLLKYTKSDIYHY